MFPDIIVQQAVAQTVTDPATGEVITRAVEVDPHGLTVATGLWVVIICGLTQALKLTWLAFALKKSRRYRRIVPLLPLLVGIGTGGAFGPTVALALTFVIPPWQGALFVGPAAGMISGWVWVLSRQAVIPIVLAIAPEAARQALVKLLAKAGIDVAEVAQLADVSIDIPRDELGLEESTSE